LQESTKAPQTLGPGSGDQFGSRLMTSTYEAGFDWHPLEGSRRWVRTICVIAVSGAIGFVAGRTSLLTSRSERVTSPSQAVSMMETKPPATLPAVRAEGPRTALTVREEPTPYVVINPGTAKDDPLVESRSTVIEEIGKHSAEKGYGISPSKRSSPTSTNRAHLRSRASREQATLKRAPATSNYLALREYVLKH
jgi:hypothetical protein